MFAKNSMRLWWMRRGLIHVVTQNRSSAAAKELRSRGFTNVKYVRGGMSEWARRGWTLESLAKP